MRIDVHTHAFHPKIVKKVVKQLEQHYQIPPVGEGTVDDLLKHLEIAGIERAVVHSAATVPEQVVPANDWAIHLQKTEEKLLAFGTIHPGFVDWEAELDRLEANGIRGIKLHPDFQKFWINDERLKPIYEASQGRFTYMIHIGDRFPPETSPSCPKKLATICRDFPGLTVIAAHFGGYLHWQFVVENLVGTGVYLDTCSSLKFIPRDLLEDIWKSFPRERFLFASDYPLFSPSEEMRLLQKRLALGDSELEEILENGTQLFPV